jgi:hypothetical protein
MYRYLVIEGHKPLNDQISIIETIFSAFIDIKHLHIESHLIIIEYEHNTEVSFYDIILNVMSDTYQDLRLYESYVFDHLEERTKHQTFILKQLSKIIQRIDKFYQTTGFDVRTFSDAFLIYHFVK